MNDQFLETEVVSRRYELKTGLYAPITEHGSIVVNGILASCFVGVENEPIQKMIYSYIFLLRRIFTSLDFYSLFETLGSSNVENRGIRVPEIVFSMLDVSKKYLKPF